MIHIENGTSDLWQIASSIVQALCAVAVAVIAWKGLNSWRDEMVVKRRHDFAGLALAKFHEVADVLRSMRSPMIWAEELFAIDREYDTQNHGRKLDVQIEALVRRGAQFQELFTEMRMLSYRAKAEFPDANLAFEAFDQFQRHYFATLTTLRGTGHDRASPNADTQMWKSMIAVVQVQSEADPTGVKIADFVKLAEKALSAKT